MKEDYAERFINAFLANQDKKLFGHHFAILKMGRDRTFAYGTTERGCGNSAFVLAGQANGAKPLEERGAGFVKHGSRGEGYLKGAFRTLPQTSGGDPEGLVMRALWAPEALGPAHWFKRILTGRLGCETFFELKQR